MGEFVCMIDFNEMSVENLRNWIGRTVYCGQYLESINEVITYKIHIDFFGVDKKNIRPGQFTYDGMFLYDDYNTGYFTSKEKFESYFRWKYQTCRFI